MSTATMHDDGDGDIDGGRRAGRAGDKPDPKAKVLDDRRDSPPDSSKPTGKSRKRKAISPPASMLPARRTRSYTKREDDFLSHSPPAEPPRPAQTPTLRTNVTIRGDKRKKFTGSFPGGNLIAGASTTNVPDIGVPSMATHIIGGGATEGQAGVATVQPLEVDKTKEELAVDRAFAGVVQAYNNYSTSDVAEDGSSTQLRKTAFELFLAVVEMERPEEVDDDDDDGDDLL